MLSTRIAHLPAAKRAALIARLRSEAAGEPAGDWFTADRRGSDPAVRLFCFPYAGGGASLYRTWPERMPAQVDVRAVQLPGREARLAEPAERRIEPLVERLHEAIEPLLDRPYAFFGHSMGALMAFVLARRLRRAHAPLPAHLFLAGFRAPHLPNPNIKIYHLPDEVIRTVLRTEGTPETVLADRELMAVLLPTLRADFELCDTYEHRDEPPLEVPISVFGGDQDVRVSRNDLEQWNAATSHGFRLTMMPGSHFFVHHCEQQLTSHVESDLRRTAATALEA